MHIRMWESQASISVMQVRMNFPHQSSPPWRKKSCRCWLCSLSSKPPVRSPTSSPIDPCQHSMYGLLAKYDQVQNVERDSLIFQGMSSSTRRWNMDVFFGSTSWMGPGIAIGSCQVAGRWQWSVDFVRQLHFSGHATWPTEATRVTRLDLRCRTST